MHQILNKGGDGVSVNEAETLFNAENSSRVLPFCAGRIMNDPVDGNTVRLAMDGDDKAFSSLFMNTYRYVYTVARHYLSNDEDIYDAIQETYTKVYANIGRLKDPEAFHSWLGKIAENSAKDIISANGRPTSELNDDTDEYLNDTSAESSKNEVNMDITAVFSQLSQEDAQLLTYIYYDGFKVTEVARMQGLAATTVYSRLNAAKRRLKQLLKLRGIEKPIYGGDIVALITTVIRNAIGTNLLSAAVADEILQSVTGKKTKAGVVISTVARKQRNAAVLRIASLIVLIVILTVGVFMGMFFAVRSALKGGAPTGGSGSDTIGVSTEVGSTDESNSSNTFGSELDASSAGQSVIGGVEQSRPNTPSESDGSSDTDSTNSTDQTVSEGNTSTGTSGDISDTSDPDSGDGIPDTNTSSGGTSSQKPSSSVITSSSKPSTSSTTGTISSPVTSGYYTYSIVNNKARITFVDPTISGDITIPSTLGGYPVKYILQYAFKGSADLTSVTIPDTVTFIGHGAFKNCTNLTSVVIGDGVKTLEGDAFRGCTRLSDITLGKNITHMSASNFASTAFYNSNWEADTLYLDDWLLRVKSSYSSNSYTVKNGIKAIAVGAFEGCSSIKTVTVPSSVKIIGSSAFMLCSDLTTLNLPNTLTDIGDNILESTSYYKATSNWEGGVLYYGNYLIYANQSIGGEYQVKDGTLVIARNALQSNDRMTSAILPDGLVSICKRAFFNCSNMRSITIPSSVNFIDDEAFSNCSRLETVYYGGSKAEWNTLISSIGTNNDYLLNANIVYLK